MLFEFAVWLAALAAASLVYTLVMTNVLREAHPYGVTLFWDGFGWSDFSIFAERSRHFGTAAYWDAFDYPFTYPAPLGVVFGLWYRLPHPVGVYLLVCVAGLAVWAAWTARGLALRGVALTQAWAFALIVLAAAWPVVALLDTANIEGLLAIVLAMGVAATLERRWWLGATLIGVAASMKWFPFVLLALLFSERRYREFVWGWVVMAATTIASLALLGPNALEAQRHVDGGMRFVKFAFLFSVQKEALNFSHSLFSPIKFAVVLVERLLAHRPVSGAASSAAELALLETTLWAYSLAVAVAGVAIYFWRIRRMPLLNQVIALTVCAVLLPPLSADYTIVELLLPFSLLCFYAVERKHSLPAGLRASFVCFAWIFGWETFLKVHYSFDRPVRALALAALLVVMLRHPMPWARLDGVEAKA